MKTFYTIITTVFILSGLACLYFRNQYTEYYNSLSVIGSLASVCGIIIAIVQAYQTKTAAQAAKEAVENSAIEIKKGMQTVQKVFLLTDITEILHLPTEIQDAIRKKEWTRALDKMHLLKDELVGFKNNPNLDADENVSQELSNILIDLNVRIRSFNKGIMNNETPYHINKTLDLMEDTNTILKTISIKEKFNHISNKHERKGN